MKIKELPIEKDIRRNGRIAQLVVSPKKSYKCDECGYPTEVGEPHYTVIFSGSGIRGIKFPARVCVGCIRTNMNLPLSWQDQRRIWGSLFDYCRDNYAELEQTRRMRGMGKCLQKIWGDINRLKEVAKQHAVRG